MMISFRNFLVVGTGALALAYGLAVVPFGAVKAADGFDVAVDKSGAIRLPKIDFQKDWVALGSWAVAAEEGTVGSEGIHVVYSQRETVAAYRRFGKFPDGAVLVKELFSTQTESMTTGTVSRADKTIGWFVMVKDGKNRFSDHELWGDGWGWAFFDAKDPSQTKTTDYVEDCKGCHVPVEETDWVYVDGYPVLKGK